jgi:hypothetical protein
MNNFSLLESTYPPDILKQYQNITLIKWRTLSKYPNNVIVQASAKDGSDSWKPFPIGMCYTTVPKNVNYFQKTGTYVNTVLCSISPTTDKIRRGTSNVNRIKIIKNLQKNYIVNQNIPPNVYFDYLLSYKFVISPEGNGIDCHRHYEALLAGCIPIIEKNPLIEKKYQGLPILYTTDYSEITEEYLNTKYIEMCEQRYDFSRLFVSFYDEPHRQEIYDCGNYWMKRHTNQIFYKNNNQIVSFITLTSSGYIDYTLNCLQSLKNIKAESALNCYCIGNDGYNTLIKEGYQATMLNNNTLSGFQTYFNEHWSDMMYMKILVIYNSLLLNDYVLYTDGDIVFENKEFFQYLITHIGDNDMLIQNDTLSDLDDSNLCCGFMFIKKTANTLHLFNPDRVARNKQNTSNWHDQGYVNDFKHMLKYKKLPLSLFPNGQYYYTMNTKITPYLIHFNWVIGNEKIDRMYFFNKWYILNNGTTNKNTNKIKPSLKTKKIKMAFI